MKKQILRFKLSILLANSLALGFMGVTTSVSAEEVSPIEISYQSVVRIGSWTGFDVFGGHFPGVLFAEGNMSHGEEDAWCGGSPAPTYVFNSTALSGATGDELFSSLVVVHSAGTDWSAHPAAPEEFFYSSIGNTGFPSNINWPEGPIDTIDSAELVYGSCDSNAPYYHETIDTMTSSATLSGLKQFNGLNYVVLTASSRYGESGLAPIATYRTSISRNVEEYSFTTAGLPAPWAGPRINHTYQGYKFIHADYRWSKKTTKFRVKMPTDTTGSYRLQGYLGKFVPIYSHTFSTPTGWTSAVPCASITRVALGLQAFSVDLTRSPDGWSQEIEFPVNAITEPVSENDVNALGYELITTDSQAMGFSGAVTGANYAPRIIKL